VYESVLIISPDVLLSDKISFRLKQEGYYIPYVALPAEGLSPLYRHLPALVILDLSTKTAEGMALLESIQQVSTALIVALIDREQEPARMRELGLRFDDYLIKPADSLPLPVGELVSTVNHLMGFEGTGINKPVIGSKSREITFQIDQGLSLKPGSRCVVLEGETVDLTPKEFELLLCLVRNHGHFLSTGQLLQVIWGVGTEKVTLLKNLVWRLRQKLEKDPGNPRRIINRQGIGYCFLGPDWELKSLNRQFEG
jgi:two-component system response regulator VicR